MTFLHRFISTVAFVGYIPFAPGTFGTLAAFVFMLVIRPPLFRHTALTFFFTIVGIISADYTEKASDRRDPGYIVIDEFAGFMISVIYLPFELKYLIAAFVLFRFFDIIKLWPIKKLGHGLKGGLGIMIDDAIAGIYTNMVLQAWRFLN